MMSDGRFYESYETRKTRKASEPKVRRSMIKVPKSCHPAVVALFTEMRRQAITYDEVEEKSGVLRTTAWRTRNAPGLTSLEAVLGVAGLAFVVAPKIESLDPALLSDLKSLAAKHSASIEHLAAHLVETRALNVALTSDGRARIERWREREAAKTEDRHTANGRRVDRLAARKAEARELGAPL